MKKQIVKYLICINCGIRNYAEYRFNIITVLIFNFLPVYVNFFLWNAVYLSNSSQVKGSSGMTFNQVISYIILIQFIDLLISTTSIDNKVMQEIKNGEICKYLLKPISYFYYNLSLSISQTLVYLIPLTIVALLIFFTLSSYIVIVNSFVLILFFIFTLVISYLLKYIIFYTLGLLGFFLHESSHLNHMFGIIFRFLAGFMFPLIFIPNTLKVISELLPFQYVGYFPTMILVGKLNLDQILKGCLISMCWIILLSFLNKIIWRNGIRKYSAFGG
jgi:ABC-2 type transport system permease protein